MPAAFVRVVAREAVGDAEAAEQQQQGAVGDDRGGGRPGAAAQRAGGRRAGRCQPLAALEAVLLVGFDRREAGRAARLRVRLLERLVVGHRRSRGAPQYAQKFASLTSSA